MKSLLACAGKINAAGCKRLAAFFLPFLFLFSACSSDAPYSNSVITPFVVNKDMYAFPLLEDETDVTGFDFELIDYSSSAWNFTRSSVSTSLKNGFVLAWDSNSKNLMHVNTAKKVVSFVKLDAAMVYVNKNYVLAQSSSFSENKGFDFTLYKVLYSGGNKKIKLKSVWSGFIDSFVSDYFFTADGVCIAGGTKDDSKCNVFHIKGKVGEAIHKCFSIDKNSDFLRLVPTGESQKVFAFMSTRDKSERAPVIYSFDMNDAPDQAVTIDLSGDSLLPAGFDCFFGYGFSAVPELVEGVEGRVILPASVDGIIQFVCYDCAAAKITGVVPDAVGCVAPLAATSEGTYYIARDPLIEDSWYGIGLFTGNKCIRIKSF